MKPPQLYLFFLCAALLFVGCTKSVFLSKDAVLSEDSPAALISRSSFDSCHEDLTCENTFVTEEDITAYLRYKSLVSDTDVLMGEYAPIVDSKGDTMMYAINYPGGWEVIAADKRCPIVLASDNKGYFVFEEQIPPVQAWLLCQGEQIVQIRGINSYEEIKDQEVVKKMQESQGFWKRITSDPAYLQDRLGESKNGPDAVRSGEGYWVLHGVTIDTVSLVLVNHLVQTHWDQNPPYNSYCPFKSGSTTQRAPAGCVAVAVGQVANYFNELCGYPEEAPLTAFCDAEIPSDGDINYYQPSASDPHMYVSNLSTTAWDSIPSNGDMCAKLLAEIGIAVEMKYTNIVSYTNSIELVKSYFDEKDFDSVYGIYSRTYLINNVTAGKPVIVAANFPLDSNYVMVDIPGHAFIVDGYRLNRIVETTTYEWVPYNPSPLDPIGLITRNVETAYNSEEITMNWGWEESCNERWFKTDGIWYSDHGSLVVEGREMFYNLTPQI